MATTPAWLGASRRLILSFVLVLLVPAAAVIWLGFRLIDQDRALALRQVREARASAADRFIAGLEQSLSVTERSLAGGKPGEAFEPDDDAVIVTIRSDAIETQPAGRLLYLPAPLPDVPEPTAVFHAGEALENREGDYDQAAARFRALSVSALPAIRAGALVRLARVLKKTGRNEEALRAYTDLANVATARIDGVPANLVARRARCALLEQLARTTQLRREAQTLQTDLIAARWAIDRGTFDAYWQQVAGWTASPAPAIGERGALSAAAFWVWRQWSDGGHGDLRTAGRRAFRAEGINVTVLWQPAGDRLVALIAGPTFQQRRWFDASKSPVDARGFTVALADSDGAPVLGALPADLSTTERRTLAMTDLPWTVFVGSADMAANLRDFDERRRLLLSGLAVLVGLVVAGGYFIVRAVSREFAVAQLQSDFVAAVSHEFRTPLTSLRQFTDLLTDDPELPAWKRRTFYQAQARATERLQRLVESLLDFGRMEAGAKPYRFQRLAVAPLVARVIEDFRREVLPDGFRIDLSIADSSGSVEIDPEAFARALWNLLDNAVKYSGTGRAIQVAIQSRDGSVAVAVRDKGIGIARHEQADIFRKFVRGAAIHAQGIPGTGIGLAMVRHIVQAHGGKMHVESAPGQGSTFTIMLPSPGVAPEHETSARTVTTMPDLRREESGAHTLEPGA